MLCYDLLLDVKVGIPGLEVSLGLRFLRTSLLSKYIAGTSYLRHTASLRHQLPIPMIQYVNTCLLKILICTLSDPYLAPVSIMDLIDHQILFDVGTRLLKDFGRLYRGAL